MSDVIIDGWVLDVALARQILFDPPQSSLIKSKRKPDIKNTKEYKKFRADVLIRDGFTCCICESVGGRLEVHHIKHKSKFPELACDVNNGITLCVYCHVDMHDGPTGSYGNFKRSLGQL